MYSNKLFRFFAIFYIVFFINVCQGALVKITLKNSSSIPKVCAVLYFATDVEAEKMKGKCLSPGEQIVFESNSCLENVKAWAFTNAEQPMEQKPQAGCQNYTIELFAVRQFGDPPLDTMQKIDIKQ